MITDFSIIEQLDFTVTVDVHADSSELSALKRHYVQQAKRFDDDGEGIDKIYFSGEYPSVYFKSVPAFTPDIIQSVVRIQRKVWNQGNVPFLYVESPVEVRVYNCYDTPRNYKKDDAEEDLRLINASKQAKIDLDELRTVFGKIAIESGGFWQETKYAERVDVKKRVDQALIENIKKTRKRLRLKKLKDDVIHDLLLRSLFVLYLEDRGATDKAFYEKYLPGASSYFEILTDLSATYRLFETLEITFNGNLCPVQDSERNEVTIEHLNEIKRCFWSDWALSQQMTFVDWRIFDFGYIPIQVISEIYEDFLRKEVGEGEMAKNGAFYTPHALAEFILNQVLPYPSSGEINYNIRTMDPTCGSGVFLVNTLNRLLDRWEYVHSDQKLTFEIIKSIVLDNIFGIEIEAEAIKVTAFSIYLTMLDRLDPKTLWQNKRFPHLIYDPDRIGQKQGKNLFRMSSLGNGSFDNIEFDLVVGNPPFGTKNVPSEILEYIENIKRSNKNHDFATQTAIAFLHRVTKLRLSSEAKIALISTSKILFNTGRTYQSFRHFLFNENYVEKIYNFSVLRRVSEKLRGRNFFASAVAPTCVIFYTPISQSNFSNKIAYYTPTTIIKNRLINGIAIDATDIKYLPRTECQKSDTKIWKVAMWGLERDFTLINRLNSKYSLLETIEQKKWDKGVGFDFFGPKEVFVPSKKTFNPDIKKLPHIPSKSVTRYYSPKNQTLKIDDEHFRRFGDMNSYNAPHVLIKEGQSKKRFCASFIDYNCSYKKSVYGLHNPDDIDDFKLLVGFLNSSFATYLMFLTSSNWGVERENIKSNEILDLPDLCFTLPIKSKEQIVAKVNEIINLKKGNTISPIDYQIAEIERQIELALWDGLNLSTTDRILIEDLLNYRLDAFQERQKSVAFKSVNIEHSQAYATHLCQTINNFLHPHDSIQARAQYFNLNRKTPLQLIILHLDEQKRNNTIEELPSDGFDEILRELEAYTYREEAESIYFRRFLRYYKDDTIYIVKPNERRFWSRSMALNDADEIILEILTSEA
ncbi:HsdM family class I SAM-dependent methyltransferase [Larkinella sp. VNQ87]|uniref:HsdM family class I SAM-dependent methyltransferase n=1 Tax=Larkinella sp. VNQ87 TaxID=3400921 RepID=UPI003C00054C